MDDMMQHTPDTHLGIADGSTKARDGVANAFDKAANRLHDSADGMGGRVTGIADRTANALDATGKYVRDFSTRNVIDDLSMVAKNHPGKSLIAAATLGLLVGRALMRPRD